MDRATYLPFGCYRRGDSSILTESGFTGHLHNDSLGLIYMNVRFYSPSLNRFISADTLIPDPANPQSYNRYSYVENSPLNYTDPTGHMASACGNNNECGFEGNSWLGQWLGWERVNPGQTPKLGGGVTASASVNTPGVSLEGNVGIEAVVDTETTEVTSFLVIGGEISFGPNSGFFDWIKRLFSDGNPSPVNATVSVYGEEIYNVDNVAVDYAGIGTYNTTTLAYGQGVTWGQTQSLNQNPNGIKAYSNQIGWTGGYALTANEGANYHVPLTSSNLATGTTTFHDPLPYLLELWSLIFPGD